MTGNETRQFLNMCLSLSAERDREALLSQILDTAMDLAQCDAGTLYLLEDDGLHFCRMVTRSQGVKQGGHASPITLPPVPLEEKYVCSWVAIHRETINVADVRTDTHFDFTGSLRYDEMTGYRTQSMMVVPMTNDRGDLIGVAQLINALDQEGKTIPFDPEIELLVSAISSQAAISLTNMMYSEQVRDLLDSLVGALSAAIDQRSPYNANHSRNMARYGEAFLNWMDETDHPWRFDPDKRRTFLMSVWLHDVGKLVVPLEVMDKETRLGPALAEIRHRFTAMALLDRIALLEGRIDQTEKDRRAADRADALAFIEKTERAGFLPDDSLARVDELAARTYTDEKGETRPWLTREEHTCLSVRKGTLTADERAVMESHVVVTGRILDQVTFPKLYAQVPQWAAGHHELLNGKGYPDHLTAPDIPKEVRLLTILDVFDALTARDRPYKPPMPTEKALSILHSMVDEGGVDGELLALFEASRAWETIPETHTHREEAPA